MQQVNLRKAEKDHVQDLQTAHEEYEVKLRTLTTRLERAEEKTRDLEKSSELARQRAEEVCSSFADV